MKIWRLRWVGLLVLVSACGISQSVVSPPETETNAAENSVAELPDCEPMETQATLTVAAETELPFERFDFRPTEVMSTETTLTFQGRRYSFTVCKRDRTWGVQALAPTSNEVDYDAYLESISNPDYESVTTAQGNTYQARVRLDAPWVDDPNASDESLEQVIFELIKPSDAEPTPTVLYTNTDIIEQEIGFTAGVPTITRALVTEDSLWWSISFEQGEGASGITTIVQYPLNAGDDIIIWQPSELNSAQITDLAITGTDEDTILWLGTQYSGEGSPYLPANGLVAYRPADDSINTYTVENSPLIGAIPSRLWTENDSLWIGTANGVCEVDWTAVETNTNWSCWRFTTMAELPATQDVYASLLADAPFDQLDASNPVEVLWQADTDISTPEASTRYEIRYEPGVTAHLDQGANYYAAPNNQEGWFWWPGQDWSWNGARFIRPWDQVAANYVGSGPQGIGAEEYSGFVADWKAMRGEFDLVTLTSDTTEIEYYSVWIDEAELAPWVTVTPAETPPLDRANPTDTVRTNLQRQAEQPQ